MHNDPPRSILRLLAALAGLGLLLGACGDDSDDGGDASPETEERGCDGDVCMEGIAYSEDSVTVEAGGTVSWTNLDGVDHTVTEGTASEPVDGGFDSGNIGEGESFDQTFDEAGEFSYYCTIHPNMEATVVVE